MNSPKKSVRHDDCAGGTLLAVTDQVWLHRRGIGGYYCLVSARANMNGLGLQFFAIETIYSRYDQPTNQHALNLEAIAKSFEIWLPRSET